MDNGYFRFMGRSVNKDNFRYGCKSGKQDLEELRDKGDFDYNHFRDIAAGYCGLYLTDIAYGNEGFADRDLGALVGVLDSASQLPKIKH